MLTPNFDPKKPFSWALGSGKVSDHGHGVILGLHLAGCSNGMISTVMDVTKTSVARSLLASKTTLGIIRPSPGSTDASPECVESSPDGTAAS